MISQYDKKLQENGGGVCSGSGKDEVEVAESGSNSDSSSSSCSDNSSKRSRDESDSGKQGLSQNDRYLELRELHPEKN